MVKPSSSGGQALVQQTGGESYQRLDVHMLLEPSEPFKVVLLADLVVDGLDEIDDRFGAHFQALVLLVRLGRVLYDLETGQTTLLLKNLLISREGFGVHGTLSMSREYCVRRCMGSRSNFLRRKSPVSPSIAFCQVAKRH